MALPGFVPHVERSYDSPYEGHRSGVAGTLYRHEVGSIWPILPGKHHHSAAFGGYHSLIPFVAGIGTCRAKAGEGAIDKLGLIGTQFS